MKIYSLLRHSFYRFQSLFWPPFWIRDVINWFRIQIIPKSNPTIDFFALSNLPVSFLVLENTFYAIQICFSIFRGLFWHILASMTSQYVLHFENVKHLISVLSLSSRKTYPGWFSTQNTYCMGIYLGFKISTTLSILSYYPLPQNLGCIFYTLLLTSKNDFFLKLTYTGTE